ncbi:MAG: branched-chain amino acid transaminase [Gemmatimonadota bacterium]
MAGGIQAVDWVWRDGEFVRWEDATIHVLSHAVQFGSSIFEGIRCYETADGPAVFRLGAHLRRFEDSCRIYRTELPYRIDELATASLDLIRRNELSACYLRPMVVNGYGAAGMVPDASPTHVFLCAWPWGTYLGEGALEDGVDVCVSSWQRPEPNTYPVAAKVAGNYLNSQLAKREALENGYVEAIELGPGGVVSEGSGQNLFLVRDGELITPAVDGTMLNGITRDSVLTLAREEGLSVHERAVPREALYTADELFFTGTAAEVTPIRGVDRIPIGNGAVGPVTQRLQKRFLDIVHGRSPDAHGWLTRVREEAPAGGAGE